MSKPLDPRQRLAAVMGKCFSTNTGATRDELRYAALSAKLGRSIVSSKDLTNKEVEQLLTEWEHYLDPFNPSDKAKAEIVELAAQYQVGRGQTEMEL